LSVGVDVSSLAWLKNRAEIILFDNGFNQRLGAINIQALCDLLDNLYGPMVSATTMKYLEFNRGKQEASKVALERQSSSIVDLVKEIIKINRITGMGITEVSLPNNSNGTGAYIVEVQNPIVKKAEGAAGVFLISYWAGALTSIIGKQLEVKTISYDESRDVIVGELATKIIVPDMDMQ